MRVILASKSIRRKELMDLAEFNYEVLGSNCEEIWNEDLSIEENSKRLSFEKAKDVFDNTQGDRAVIGSDTIVVKDGNVYGKPKNRDEAIEMLKDLQGNKHTVYTSLSVLIENMNEYKEYIEVYSADIYIKPMENSEIINYIDSYDVSDKAGAYAIQSKFAVYIEKINGDYSTIVGLPINRLYDIFKENEIW
ncbi:MAG: septum formation protein Maf [Clostridia bacterium]|nr:septum formation protein Maf [Clostridia bacterium]